MSFVDSDWTPWVAVTLDGAPSNADSAWTDWVSVTLDPEPPPPTPTSTGMFLILSDNSLAEMVLTLASETP